MSHTTSMIAGTELSEGMTFVDGYGYHYRIETVSTMHEVENGFLTMDGKGRAMVVRAIGGDFTAVVKIHQDAEYKVVSFQ